MPGQATPSRREPAVRADKKMRMELLGTKKFVIPPGTVADTQARSKNEANFSKAIKIKKIGTPLRNLRHSIVKFSDNRGSNGSIFVRFSDSPRATASRRVFVLARSAKSGDHAVKRAQLL